MRLGTLGLRRNLAVVLLCTIQAAQLWRCTEANALSSLFQWKQPKDLTDEFLAVNKKPIMMIIHKSWCGTCSHLRSQLNDVDKNKEILSLSDDFVMVNAQDANEPSHPDFAPDGMYIPRIVFLDSKGKIQPQHKCELNHNPVYKYFYSSVAQVAHTMQRIKATLYDETQEVAKKLPTTEIESGMLDTFNKTTLRRPDSVEERASLF